jgi:arylsulfatase A-like enzyme
VATSNSITDRALAYFREDAEAPRFVFAHYFDPHSFYLDHDEWDWTSENEVWLELDAVSLTPLSDVRHLLGGEELAWIRAHYDEEIRYTDREIGRLIDGLEADGLTERTLIVVVSDHGDEFMEHGRFGHVGTVYEPLVSVPLFVVLPGYTTDGPTVSDLVETRSVFTTVLEALGIDYGFASRPHGLLELEGPDGQVRGRTDGPSFSMVWMDSGPKTGVGFKIVGVRDGRWKLIVDHTRGLSFLYDLEADPGETTDLSDEEPEVLARLLRIHEDWIGEQLESAGEVPKGLLDEELEQRLKALGYL